MQSEVTLLESRRRAAGHVALLVVQLCFSLFPIFGKFALVPGAFTPLTVSAWRMVFAALFLGLVAFAFYGRRAWPSRADLGWLAVCSFLGVTANMVLYLEGLKLSTATNAGVMMCLIPVFTFAIAALFRQEVFKLARAAGLMIALAGASLLFWAERPDLVRAHGLGNGLMALNTLCYAGYLVLSRPLTRRYPPLVVIAWVFILSVPWVPLLVWRDVQMSHGGALPTIRAVLFPALASAKAWWSLAFILVFPTAVAYLLNTFALSRLRASTTAVYVYVQPVITGLFGWWLLDDEPTRVLFVSAAVVFLGIWLVARRPKALEPTRAERAALESEAGRTGPARP
jgi:drug/metabolite transporter (DMT)-like permease